MTEASCEFILRRKGDQVVLRRDGADEDVPVRILWARPATGRGAHVSIVDAKKKTEVALLRDLDRLDAESRALAEEELATRYLLPKITRVYRTDVHYGNRYWHVETDRGPRRFLVKSPETDVLWVHEDRCILRDALGGCYEIESRQALDAASRAQAEKVL